MKLWIASLLSLFLLLSGCSAGTNTTPEGTSTLNPRPTVLTTAVPKTTQGSTQSGTTTGTGQTAPQKEANVRLTWDTRSEGEWPLDCTLETLQFADHDNEKLDDINEQLRSNTESELQRYYDCAALREDERYEQSASWGDIWVYPVSGERYLNAVWVWRERTHFYTFEPEPWKLVGSVVYDTGEDRIVTLEEAYEKASVDQGDLEKAIWEYVADQEIGIYEKLSSCAFYMEEDGTPVFMVGAIVNQPELPIPWTIFFTWRNGIVECTVDHPLQLYQVDTEFQDELSCFKSMGQYDGAAVITEEEAADLLREVYEVQEYLSQGMEMIFDGTAEWIDSEYCVCIALGTEHEDNFVREVYYAVTWDTIYRLDPVYNTWEIVGFG